MPSCRTFIVEDSSVIADNLVQALEEMTSVVVAGVARSEVDAIRWLNDHKGAYELVIVDIFLQAGSGLGVLRGARALMADATFVVLTNYATPDMQRVCQELGAVQVFDKSTELDELVDFCRGIAGTLPTSTVN
jgi:DNA-binding NtrC family response regulator